MEKSNKVTKFMAMLGWCMSVLASVLGIKVLWP